MKQMIAKDAWKEMTDKDPAVQLLKILYKFADPATGKCRCDICKRLIDDCETVHQDEKHPITICEQCYNPETDYRCLPTENRINVTFREYSTTLRTKTTPCPKNKGEKREDL